MAAAKSSALLILLAICFSPTFAQDPRVMLQKRNHHKSAYYKVGDPLSFYLRGNHQKHTRQISAILRDTIVFGNLRVGLHDIAAIHIDEKTKWWIRFKYSQVLLIGGIGYMLLESINSGDVDQQTLLIGGTAVGAGLLFRILFPHKIRLNARTRLRILEMQIP